MNARIGIACLLTLLVSDSAWTLSLPDLLNPTTYRSPSGEYACTVDPTQRDGSGPANYQMQRHGTHVWTGTRDVTLQDAIVTDDGRLAGIGYTEGRSGTRFDRPGQLRVVLFDAQGTVLWDEATPREPSRYFHGLPQPVVEGVFSDPVRDRWVARIRIEGSNTQEELWWIYSLSTGQPANRIEYRQAEPAVRFLIRAVPIPNTPLILTHSWRYQDRAGARFALIQGDLEELWSLTWPSDYTVPEDEAAALRERIFRESAILATNSNRFTLRAEKSGEQVHFSVSPDVSAPGRWTVSETGRQKLPAPTKDRTLASRAPTRPLRRLGTTLLEAQTVPAASAVRNVMTFDFDEQGRIGFLRYEGEDASAAFVLVTDDGRPIRERALPAAGSRPDDAQLSLGWIAGDRWIVTRSDIGRDGRAKAWWIDGPSGAITLVREFDCPAINAIAGDRNGGFVVLAVKRGRYSQENVLIAFDRDGRLRWQVQNDHRPESPIFSPVDLTVSDRLEVVVLGSIKNSLEYFDLGGTHRRTVKLKEAWGREPNYPSGVAADSDGGVVVEDFNGSPPLVRMTSSGAVRSEFPVRNSDGHPVTVRAGLRVSPSGAVWISDGESLMEVDESGLAVRSLRPAPDPEILETIAAVTVDAAGRLYAADGRSGSVHVFDAEGRRLRICRPDSGDFPEAPRFPTLTVGADGEVWIRDSDPAEELPQFLVFHPDGTRAGMRSIPLESVRIELWPLPEAGRFLVLGMDEAHLWKHPNLTLQTIQRRPDRQWLRTPLTAAVAPDGSLAIVSDSTLPGETQAISLYSAAGDPVRVIPFSSGQRAWALAYSGKYLILPLGPEILLLDRDGNPKLRFTPEGINLDTDDCRLFSAAGGRELWVVSAAKRSVTRYELP